MRFKFFKCNESDKIMKSRRESFIGLASENDLRIALHYQGAFEVLYKSNKYQDEIVLPSLFMIRQFLELGLKYNIKKLLVASKSSDSFDSLSKEHKLDKLHNSFLGYYRQAKIELSIKNIKDYQLLSDLKSLVDLVIVFDNNSMGYRYSANNNGDKQIPNTSSYNLENIYRLQENVITLLTGIDEIFRLTENS